MGQRTSTDIMPLKAKVRSQKKNENAESQNDADCEDVPLGKRSKSCSERNPLGKSSKSSKFRNYEILNKFTP